MEKQEFVTGQLVELTSGGPVMTIMGVNAFSMNPENYVCQWFAGKSYRQQEFPGQNLKLAAPKKKKKRVIAGTLPQGLHRSR